MGQNKWKREISGAGRVAVAVVCAAIGLGLLIDAAAVSQGIRDGLSVCGNVLIPSLFPFMVLSGFISRTDSARILSAPLTPITTKVYKLPANMGVVVLLGLIGGYPVGARMVANLLEQGEIDRATAQRMLCFCVNSGPSFLISAVGVGMLLSKQAGVILFATQTFTTLLIGALASAGISPPPKQSVKKDGGKIAPAFVEAATGASSSMLVMCAFAVLFSGVLALVREAGVVDFLAGILPLSKELIDAVLCGLFEVTTGCLSAAKIGGVWGFGLICVFVSFSGLSVLFQIISCFKSRELKFGSFVCIRLIHGALSAAMGVPLYQHFCGEELAVWGPGIAPVMQTGGNTMLVSGCLIAMCSILVLYAGKRPI